MDRTAAFGAIHAPESFAEQERARRRLAFDELLRLQLEVVMRRHVLERDSRGHPPRRWCPAPAPPASSTPSSAQLPFPLTAAQRRAVDEISADLAKALPMHRLLQGDVGSGKTVVALSALLVAVQGGHQGALMAPTEVLAEQHYLGVRELLADLVVPDPERLGDRGRWRWRCSPTGRRRGSGPSCTRDCGPARSTSWWAPTPCSPTRCGSRASGSW